MASGVARETSVRRHLFHQEGQARNQKTSPKPDPRTLTVGQEEKEAVKMTNNMVSNACGRRTL